MEVLIPSMVLSQPDGTGFQLQLDDLRHRIELLEKENHSLTGDIRAKDSLQYCIIRQQIFEAYSNIPQLDLNFKNTSEKIAVTGLFTKLMQANNPSSDILGFRFTEIIFAACEKNFLHKIKEEKEKKRFGQVINKIINSPVLSSLANTNPVTSVVSAIISTIAAFSTPVVELQKEGNRIKEIQVENQDVFDQQSLEAFRDELQVYIDFYDALILSSENYLVGLEQLDTKYSGLMESVAAYQTEMYNMLGGEKNNMISLLSILLPDPEHQPVDFSKYLTDLKVTSILTGARKLPVLQQSVFDFKKEYNGLLFKFLNNYLSTLEKSDNFTNGTVDPVRINALKEDIISFIESQKDALDGNPDVFSSN